MNLKQAIYVIYKKILDIRPNEKLLILFDNHSKELIDDFYEIGSYIAYTEVMAVNESKDLVEAMSRFNPKIGIIEEVDLSNIAIEEPSDEVIEKMLKANVIVILNLETSHSKARIKANMKGARIISIPYPNKELIIRIGETDYKFIENAGLILKDLFNDVNEARVITDVGTDIRFSIKGRSLITPEVKLDYPGAFSFLPLGEASIAPLEGTANGKVVINGSILGNFVDEPIFLDVKDGLIKSIKGGKSADQLRVMLKKIEDFYGEKAYTLAEFSIGINPTAKIIGHFIEDKKVYKTSHIAIGENISLGGKIYLPIHVDAVFYKPDVLLDNKLIIRDGELTYKAI